MASERLVDLIFRSATGLSLEHRPADRPFLPSDYAVAPETRDKALAELRHLGFRQVGPASDFGVTIGGPPELVDSVFGSGTLRVPKPLSVWIESAKEPPPADFFSPP